MWWYIPVIPAPGRWRPEEEELKSSGDKGRQREKVTHLGKSKFPACWFI